MSSPSSMKPELVMLLARGRSWEGIPRGSTVVGFSWNEDEELACPLMGMVAGSGKLALGAVGSVSRSGHVTWRSICALTTNTIPY